MSSRANASYFQTLFQFWLRFLTPESGVAQNTACHRKNGWHGVPKPSVPAAALFPLRTSSKRCRAEYRLPPHQNGWRGVPKPSVPAAASFPSPNLLKAVSRGIPLATAKWLARRPEALRPGGSVLECGGKRYSARHRFSRLRHECRPLATASRARIGKSACILDAFAPA